MKLIVGQWHLGGRQGNHGDAGNTLEDLLDIEENNLRLPDFGEVEIKTQKYEGGSLLTVFHQEPKPARCVPHLCNSLGWRHGEAGKKYPASEMSFRSTTWGSYYSVRGFTVQVVAGQVRFVYDPEQVSRDAKDVTGVYENYGQWADSLAKRNPHYTDVFPIYYELEDIQNCFVKKASHTMMVGYKSKTVEDKKYYCYEEAYLGKEVVTSAIEELITDGSIAVDFDARTGHNHGTKFRIKKDQQHRLFNQFALME